MAWNNAILTKSRHSQQSWIHVFFIIPLILQAVMPLENVTCIVSAVCICIVGASYLHGKFVRSVLFKVCIAWYIMIHRMCCSSDICLLTFVLRLLSLVAVTRTAERHWTWLASMVRLFIHFLPARRYASAGNCDRNVSVCPSVRLSVRHAPVLCQNEES